MTTRKRIREGTARVPWNREESARFVCEAWSDFADWMNRTQLAESRNGAVSDDWMDLRSRLNGLAGYPEDWWSPGAPPQRGKPKLMSGVAVPAGHLMIRRGVLTLNLGGRAPGIYKARPRVVLSKGKPVEKLGRATLNEEALKARRNLWMRLLVVLSAEPDLRNRVRACAECGRYVMLKTARADRGKGYRADFCSIDCGRAHKREGDRERQKDAYRRRREKDQALRPIRRRSRS